MASGYKYPINLPEEMSEELNEVQKSLNELVYPAKFSKNDIIKLALADFLKAAKIKIANNETMSLFTSRVAN